MTRSLDADFARFYETYPRHVGRKAAARAFDRAVGDLATERHTSVAVAVAVIIDAARMYAEDPNLPERQFVPHPTTWLNQGRWDDEPCAPKPTGRAMIATGQLSDTARAALSPAMRERYDAQARRGDALDVSSRPAGRPALPERGD